MNMYGQGSTKETAKEGAKMDVVDIKGRFSRFSCQFGPAVIFMRSYDESVYANFQVYEEPMGLQLLGLFLFTFGFAILEDSSNTATIISSVFFPHLLNLKQSQASHETMEA